MEPTSDVGALARWLAAAIVVTDDRGKVTRKTQELERYQGRQVTLSAVEQLAQSAVAIDNNTAVEHGQVRYVGTDGDRRVDVVKRYTPYAAPEPGR